MYGGGNMLYFGLTIIATIAVSGTDSQAYPYYPSNYPCTRLCLDPYGATLPVCAVGRRGYRNFSSVCLLCRFNYYYPYRAHQLVSYIPCQQLFASGTGTSSFRSYSNGRDFGFSYNYWHRHDNLWCNVNHGSNQNPPIQPQPQPQPQPITRPPIIITNPTQVISPSAARVVVIYDDNIFSQPFARDIIVNNQYNAYCDFEPNTNYGSVILSNTLGSNDYLVIVASTTTYPNNITKIMGDINILIPVSQQTHLYLATVPTIQGSSSQLISDTALANTRIRALANQVSTLHVVDLATLYTTLIQYNPQQWGHSQICAWLLQSGLPTSNVVTTTALTPLRRAPRNKSELNEPDELDDVNFDEQDYKILDEKESTNLTTLQHRITSRFMSEQDELDIDEHDDKNLTSDVTYSPHRITSRFMSERAEHDQVGLDERDEKDFENVVTKPSNISIDENTIR